MPTAQLNTNGIGSLTSSDVTAEQLDAIRERIGPLEGLGSLVTPFKIPQNFQTGGVVTDEEINKALGSTVRGSFATGRSSGFLGGVADELAARTAGGTRVAFGQGSYYTPGSTARFLSAKDIPYQEPGSVAGFYGVTTDNIFSEGQHLSRFQREAVQKGVTSGGNAGILADLRSSKNLLGQQPAQAALLRQYLSTGVVPEGLSPQFAVNAYDWAIREQGRQQQTKKPGFLQGFIGSVIGTIGGATIGFFLGGPQGAVLGAKIGGSLGGAGQAINEKRGILGIALGALQGYGVGSFGGGIIESFSKPIVGTAATATAAGTPAFGGGVGYTLRTLGPGPAFAQAGSSLARGIASLHPANLLSSARQGLGSLVGTVSPKLGAKIAPLVTSVNALTPIAPLAQAAGPAAAAGAVPSAAAAGALPAAQHTSVCGKTSVLHRCRCNCGLGGY